MSLLQQLPKRTKAQHTAQLVDDLVTEGGRPAVFVHFGAALAPLTEALAERGIAPTVLDGRGLDDAADEFQCAIVVGHAPIHLPSATHSIFYDVASAPGLFQPFGREER